MSFVKGSEIKNKEVYDLVHNKYLLILQKTRFIDKGGDRLQINYFLLNLFKKLNIKF